MASGPAANKLAIKNYTIYEWDVEWHMSNRRAVETPEKMLGKIQSALSNNKTKKKDKIIVLMHDITFREFTISGEFIGGKTKLKKLIKLLQEAGFSFDFVSNY